MLSWEVHLLPHQGGIEWLGGDDGRCFTNLNDALSQADHLDLMGASRITGNIVYKFWKICNN